MSVNTANRDLALLHPLMREKAQAVLADCQQAGLPLRVFEAWRSPERQRFLFAKGRTTPGPIVTYAKAWQSYHQYGLAADFVGFIDGNWTWNLPDATWRKLHRFGENHGLEKLGFETPHLQVVGLKIGDLMDGDWPEGEDDSWSRNIADAISRWDGEPSAPPLPADGNDRPPFSASAVDWSSTPTVQNADWTSMFNGQEWRVDAKGVYLRLRPSIPQRTPGAPTTCQSILALYGIAIHKASLAYSVPPELIVMTIATETAFARNWDFTGPRTFRWEPHVLVKDVSPQTHGDYSAGPMQTLATTAREVIRDMDLDYPDPFKVAPYFAAKPEPSPARNPLYSGDANIDLGTAEIKTRWQKTGSNPILVAAAFNAGGLYRSDQNVWHIRSANDHIDRAAAWFGDACFVLAPLRGSA